jgi:hypothetical protein
MGPLKIALSASTGAVAILLFALPALFERLQLIKQGVELDIKEVRTLEDQAWYAL